MSSNESLKNSTNSMDSTAKKTTKKVKKRCSFEGCNKKLKLTDFECRCELIFCPNHRLPENHICKFDFRSEGCKILEKNLPKIVCSKILKI